jgi:hypothetical protein
LVSLSLQYQRYLSVPPLLTYTLFSPPSDPLSRPSHLHGFCWSYFLHARRRLFHYRWFKGGTPTFIPILSLFTHTIH